MTPPGLSTLEEAALAQALYSENREGRAKLCCMGQPLPFRPGFLTHRSVTASIKQTSQPGSKQLTIWGRKIRELWQTLVMPPSLSLEGCVCHGPEPSPKPQPKMVFSSTQACPLLVSPELEERLLSKDLCVRTVAHPEDRGHLYWQCSEALLMDILVLSVDSMPWVTWRKGITKQSWALLLPELCLRWCFLCSKREMSPRAHKYITKQQNSQ